MEKGRNLPIIKKKNCSLIKETIYRHSPISRIEVAQRLSLTNPTITNNVAALIGDGMVKEIGTPHYQGERPLGRRPVLLDFVPDARYVVGVELGPYNTLMLVSDLRGHVICRSSDHFAETSYTKMVETLAASILKIIADSGVDQKKIAGVGICLPGFVDTERGTVHNNLRQDWVARKLLQDVQKKISHPVCVENNVRARAIGADLFGKKVDGDPLLYYFVSYGLACSLVVDHRVLSGKAAGAGEVGHMVVEMDGPHCDTCGNNGCLEAIASENAILKRCQALLDAGVTTILRDICAEEKRLSIKDVLKAQACGDPAVTSVLSSAIRYIGINVSNLMNFISPESVLIDGRIFSAEVNQKMLTGIVAKNVFGGVHKGYRIQFVEYDKLGGAKGAAAIAVKKFVLE